MAGAYRLALSRATVTLPDGTKHGPGTVSVRDGMVRIKVGAAIAAEARAVNIIRHSKSSYTIEGPDGDWQVDRPCGCAGGR